MKKPTFFTMILGLLFLASCASTLPKETVKMSVLLEKQIDVLEKNHIDVINLYFVEKKLQTKTFVDNELYPAWLDDFFGKDVVKKGWNEAVEGDSAKRMETFKGIVKIVQNEYNVLLQTAMAPLDKLHVESLEAIREEYQKARSMNRTIGENISSVHEVQEARNQLIPQKIKDAEDALHQYLQKADDIVDTMRNSQNE
ncbi:MAG: hypothetical protein LBI42_09525 [Chitinispirillales bacterium]|nr:hypothetical protein [Chitinispirillales bacterium]